MTIVVSIPSSARTLRELCAQALNELGMDDYPQVVGSTDVGAKQLLSLAIREGSEMYAHSIKYGGWSELTREWTFTLQSGLDQYEVPDDFSFMLPGTDWNRTRRWRNVGPMSPQEWQVLKSGITPTGPRIRYRIEGRILYVNPTPGTNLDAMVLEYVSTDWAASRVGLSKARFDSDDDYYLLDEEAFIAGLKWRWLRAKGLDYLEEMKTYEGLRDRAMARSGGTRDLPLTNTSSGLRFLSDINVPDSGFGS